MFDFIEKVVYINLDYRTDRREEIENELSKYFSQDKIIRFDAVKYPVEIFESEKPHPSWWTIGLCGCIKSHIAVLEMAKKEGWNNVLIIEDDSTWSNVDNGYSLLEKLVKDPFDVILLGSAHTECVNYKVISANCANAYIVQKHYYEKLIDNLKEALPLKIANDQNWKKLQQIDNWFCIVPSMMIQRPSFSNIENNFADYTHLFC